MAGALLIGTLIATAVGFASPSHADDVTPTPNIDATATVPALVAPWLPPLDGYAGSWRIHCGFPGWQGPFRCWY
ncbi:hypothetical protein A5641_04340 [Mycobacterium sp. 1554424.7]|nr:hypothetical protein A5641_04340 [Mycobacterium sp. 1554424.7]